MYKNRAGFTLIELLVVVAIIVVLMAILMPSLGRAREQAKSLLCQTQARSLAIADIMYADENNGWITPVTQGSTSWWGFLRPYWKNQVFRAPDGTAKEAPFCNVFVEKYGPIAPSVWTYPNNVTGYHFNNRFYSYGLGRKFSISANPSRVVRIWDDTQVFRSANKNCDGGFPWQSGGPTNGGSWYQLDFRHVGNTLNVAFLDGHVEFLKWTNLGAKGEPMAYPTAYCYPQFAWDDGTMKK